MLDLERATNPRFCVGSMFLIDETLPRHAVNLVEDGHAATNSEHTKQANCFPLPAKRTTHCGSLQV